MTKDELTIRVTRVRNIINDADLSLCRFFGPAFDEDYKVEREPALTAEAFDRVEQFANEFADIVERRLTAPTSTERRS